MFKSLFILLMLGMTSSIFATPNVEEYTATVKVRCIKLKTITEKYCTKSKTVREVKYYTVRGRKRSRLIRRRVCVTYASRPKQVLTENAPAGYFNQKNYADKTCFAYVKYK